MNKKVHHAEYLLKILLKLGQQCYLLTKYKQILV